MTARSSSFLKSVDILSSLSAEELKHVRRYLGEMECQEGDAVFQQGDVGTELYIVSQGTVSIRVKTMEGDDVELAQFGEGDFFGFGGALVLK